MYNGALQTALKKIRALNDNDDREAIERFIKKTLRKIAEQQCV